MYRLAVATRENQTGPTRLSRTVLMESNITRADVSRSFFRRMPFLRLAGGGCSTQEGPTFFSSFGCFSSFGALNLTAVVSLFRLSFCSSSLMCDPDLRDFVRLAASKRQFRGFHSSDLSTCCSSLPFSLSLLDVSGSKLLYTNYITKQLRNSIKARKIQMLPIDSDLYYLSLYINIVM